MPEGLVERVTVYEEPGVETPTAPGLIFRSKIWYRDSFAIEEVLSSKTTMAQGNITTIYINEYYRFSNIYKPDVYQFKNFSDTAACFKNYIWNDTTKTEAGWNFNGKKGIQYDVEPVMMNDTIIEDVLYKRMRFSFTGKGYTFYKIYYLRCDKKTHPFNFDQAVSKKIGCPVTITHFTDSTYKTRSNMDKINFITDRLTPEENKVFDAWVAYVKAHPVSPGN